MFFHHSPFRESSVLLYASRILQKSKNALFTASSRIDLCHLLLLFLVLAYLMAFYSGFRMPNSWTSHSLIPSIFDGFYRRSFFGTILYPFGDLRFSYYFTAAIQFIFFIFLNIFLIRHFFSLSNVNFKFLFILFIATHPGAFFFHEIGYAEQYLFLFLIAALSSRSVVASSIILSLSLLSHEMALFTIIPLFVVYRLYKSGNLKEALLPAGICCVVFLFIFLFFQNPTQETLLALREKTKALVDYPFKNGYFNLFEHSITGVRQKNHFQKHQIFEIILCIAFSLCAGWTLSRKYLGWKRVLTYVSGVLASVAPLALGFFGWDCNRWIFLSLCSSLFILHLSQHFLNEGSFYISVFILVLFFSIGSFDYFNSYSFRLRDEHSIKHFFFNDFAAELQKKGCL